MCSVGEDEDVEHVLMKCESNKSERGQLWEGMRTECWERLDEVKVVLGKDVEEDEATDKSVKKFIRTVIDKRRRWMYPGNGQ